MKLQNWRLETAAIQGNSWLHYQICTYWKYQFATAYIDGHYLGNISSYYYDLPPFLGGGGGKKDKIS